MVSIGRRPTARRAVALMGSLGVVFNQPGIEIGLQLINAGVEGGAKGGSKELIQHREIEALDKAIGTRRAYLGAPMLNVIEVQVEFERMGFPATELAAIVGQESTDPPQASRSW